MKDLKHILLNIKTLLFSSVIILGLASVATAQDNSIANNADNLLTTPNITSNSIHSTPDNNLSFCCCCCLPNLYVSPVLKQNGKIDLTIGGKVGWYLNDQLILGTEGYRFANGINLEAISSEQFDCSGGYGGLFLEYKIVSGKKTSISVPLLIGTGEIELNNRGILKSVNEVEVQNYKTTSNFFVTESGINVTFQVAKYVGIGFGTSYLFVNGLNFSNQSFANRDLAGLTTNISLKIGKL